jgi:hypothetical protein
MDFAATGAKRQEAILILQRHNCIRYLKMSGAQSAE